MSIVFRGATAHTVLASCAALAISTVSAWSSAHSEIQNFLPKGKTILTARAADLASAVANTIIGGTDASLTPATLAAAAAVSALISKMDPGHPAPFPCRKLP
jgi:hypothetical protein